MPGVPGENPAADRERVACAYCEFDREGLGRDAPCPECGRVTPSYTRIPGRVRCVACGYALSGLALDARCPECGVGVRWSLRGMLLEHRDSAFVRRLRRGAGLAAGGVLAMLTLGAVAVVLGLLVPLSAIGPAGGPLLSPAALDALVSWLALGVVFLFLWGWWMLTTPDAGPAGPGERPRRLTRIAAAVAGASALIATLAASLIAVLGWQAWLDWAIDVGTLTGIAAGTMLFFAGLFYLRELALRIPSLPLRRTAGRRAWLCPLVTVIGFCVLFVGPLAAAVLYYLVLSRARAELSGVTKRMRLQGVPPGEPA